MKTLIAYPILMALILPVLLSAQAIQMSIPNMTGVRGTTILVPVRIDSSVTGYNVTSYQLSIQFSDYMLAVDSVVLTETMTQTAGMSLYFSKPQSNIVTIAAAGSAPMQGIGVLIYIRFKIIRSGYTAISFTDASHNLLNEGTPAVLLVNGNIFVSEPPTIWVYPNSKVLSVGEQLQLSVGGATNPVHWSVTNSSVASIDLTGLLTANNRGTTRVVATDDKGIIDTTDGIIEVRALKLIVPDTVTVVDRLIDIPIYCSSLSGLEIVAGEINLVFNDDIITPLALIKSGTLLQTYPDPSINTTIKGRVNIAFAGAAPLSGEGILCKVRFTVKQTGWTQIDFSEAVFNESLIAKTVKGSMQVQSTTLLNINPQEGNFIVGDTLRFTVTNGTPPYIWEVTDTTLASIDSDGLFSARKSGTVHVVVHDAAIASGVTGDIKIYNVKAAIGNVYAVAGMIVEVPIRIERFDGGATAIAFQTVINFDSSALKAVEVVNAGTLSEGWWYGQTNPGNRLSIAAAGTTGFHTTGMLFKVRFQVRNSLPIEYYTSITFGQLLLNEGDPSVLIIDGSVLTVAVPTEPYLIAPYDGMYDLPHDVQFSWNAPSRVETYRLQIAKNNLFTTIMFQDSMIIGTSRLVTGLTDGLHYWRVNASNVAGNSAWSSIRSFFVGPQVGVNETRIAPKQFALLQNYPNPFNPSTTIEFTLAEDSKVSLKVFDILGREIKILVNGTKRAGIIYQVEFNASTLPSGIYLYRLQAGEKSLVKKLIIMK